MITPGSFPGDGVKTCQVQQMNFCRLSARKTCVEKVICIFIPKDQNCRLQTKQEKIKKTISLLVQITRYIYLHTVLYQVRRSLTFPHLNPRRQQKVPLNTLGENISVIKFFLVHAVRVEKIKTSLNYLITKKTQFILHRLYKTLEQGIGC